MSGPILVEPDARRPGGGTARLVVPAGSLAAGTAAVAVYDLFGERYLGAAGWQTSAARFGPYPVARDPDGRLAVTVGPEIVDHITEFTALRLEVGAVAGVVSWPDTIGRAPGVAPLGRILSDAPAELPGRLVRPRAPEPPLPLPEPPPPQAPVVAPARPEPLAPPAPEAAPAPQPAPAPRPAADPGPPRGRSGWLIQLLLLTLLGATGAAMLAYYARPQAPTADPDPLVVLEPPAAPRAVPPCSIDDALTAGDGPAAALGRAIEDAEVGRCDGAIDAAFGLRLIQRSADQGSAEALMMLGRLYDAATADPLTEDRLGLALADRPDIALDYYARAVAGGVAEAPAALAGTCGRTADATDALIENARREHCP